MVFAIQKANLDIVYVCTAIVPTFLPRELIVRNVI